MHRYLDILDSIMTEGVDRTDRTGVGTRSIFGWQTRFDLAKGFPMLTTKKLHWSSIVHEMLWFLSGDTNTAYLREHGISIWDKWATETGDLGPVYGSQWRRWKTSSGLEIDQISNTVEAIKNDQYSRAIAVSVWNPEYLPDPKKSPQENVKNGKMALAPCHAFFQFYIANGKLSCMLTQRSADCFLGLAFNIPSYALLTHMMAQQCGLEVGELVWSGGDVHIYNNHFDQVGIQLKREPTKLPTLEILRKPETIFDYRFEDFKLNNYIAQPHIPAPVAV